MKKTSSSIQQHKRTRHSSCTLLFTRIASAIALAPSSPISLLLWETFRARKEKQNGNVSETQVKQTSSSIQQHKRTSHSPFTLLFTRIASAIALAPSSAIELLYCETFRARKEKQNGNFSETKVKKRQAAFSNTNAQAAASARCCSRASHLRSPWHRRRRSHCWSVKHSEPEKKNKTETSAKQK